MQPARDPAAHGQWSGFGGQPPTPRLHQVCSEAGVARPPVFQHILDDSGTRWSWGTGGFSPCCPDSGLRTSRVSITFVVRL